MTHHYIKSRKCLHLGVLGGLPGPNGVTPGRATQSLVVKFFGNLNDRRGYFGWTVLASVCFFGGDFFG